MSDGYELNSQNPERVRENAAQRIERGDVPSMQVREERQVKAEQQRGPER